MSSDQSAHGREDAQPWNRTFAELVARNIDPNDETLLIIAPSEADATRLEASIKQNLHTALREFFSCTDSRETLPDETGGTDATVVLNPHECSQTLQQAANVTRESGAVIYRAPQRLAHGEEVELDTIYSLNSEGDSTPSLAALMTAAEPALSEGEATTPGDNSATDTTISAFL
jgi:hypothetical protein